MPQCCVSAVGAELLRRFPGGQIASDFSAEKNIYAIAERWGKPASGYLDVFELRVVREATLRTAANVTMVACGAGHERSVIFMGWQLGEFVWRVTMALAGYWHNVQDGLDPKPGQKWPTPEALVLVAIALKMYFGNLPFSRLGFDAMHDMVAIADPVAAKNSEAIADLAQLFVIMHECNHVHLYPDWTTEFELPADEFQVSAKRKARWVGEMRIDAVATYLLMLTACRRYLDLGLPLNQARVMGCAHAFSGIDTMLHALVLLEQVRYGDSSPRDWAVDPAWSAHPPARKRRNVWSFASRTMSEGMLGPDGLEQVRRSIASNAFVRQRLFEPFLGEKAIGI